MNEFTDNFSGPTSNEWPPFVVLVHPPAVSKRYLKTKFMPYGMAVIYAFLKEHAVSVRQYDFLMEYLFSAADDIDYHNPEKTFSEADFFSSLHGRSSHIGLAEFTDKYGSRLPNDAKIYAFSIVTYHQFWAALLLARHIRNANPDGVIVFGGPFITIKPAETFVKYGIADYWVKGSGERPLLMLYKLYQNDRGVSKREIPGLIYLEEGSIVENPKSVQPAEEERAPDFQGLQLHQYKYDHPLTGQQTLFLPYRISKGCPSRCTFCTGRLVDKYDVKSVAKIVSELLSLSEEYKTANFMFADASINGSPRLLGRLCDRLSENIPNIRWYAYSRVRGFDEELLKKVKKVGCFSLFWGVESGHQRTVELLGKRFRVEEMFKALDQAIALGIKNYVHLIYNTPHESEEDVASFVRLVERYLRSDRVVFLPQRFLLEPQSLMFENPDAYGLRNIVRVDRSVFEREEFTYEEVGRLTYEGIEQRNEAHRKLLADHLDWIRYRNMQENSDRRVARWIPSKVLVQTGKRAGKSRVAAVIHNFLTARLQSGRSGIREQM